MGWDEGAPHRNEPLCWFLQNPASTMLSSGGAGILLQSLHESLHVTLNVDSTSMGLMYENPVPSRRLGHWQRKRSLSMGLCVGHAGASFDVGNTVREEGVGPNETAVILGAVTTRPSTEVVRSGTLPEV